MNASQELFSFVAIQLDGCSLREAMGLEWPANQYHSMVYLWNSGFNGTVPYGAVRNGFNGMVPYGAVRVDACSLLFPYSLSSTEWSQPMTKLRCFSNGSLGRALVSMSAGWSVVLMGSMDICPDS